MKVFFKRKNVDIIASHDSDDAIYNGACRRFLSSLVWILSSVYLAACDFHGPWEYYPEERDTYVGIYTYGYILDNRETRICFSKVYQLDEISAQSFAFYDSAYVTVQGVFGAGSNHREIDTTVTLNADSEQSNCFEQSYYGGIVGKSYTMTASFKWDSAGQSVVSTYRGKATIPNRVKIKGINAPQQDGSYKWKSNGGYERGLSSSNFTLDFLEYPMDMQFVKVALDYDNSVRGVLSILNYNTENKESQNTTINHMFKGMTDADEQGYRGIAMHDPLESQQNLGFTSNRTVAGNGMLDTLYLTNMMLPLGEFSVDLYSTDDAYIDYMDKVKQSVMDSRVVPESNIENGMGVFSGMARTVVYLTVNGDGVQMTHIARSNCEDEKGDLSDSWDSRACRLFQDVSCAGLGFYKNWGDNLIEVNAMAPYAYRDSVYNRNVKMCYPSNVKAAMVLDTTKWSLFLPDTISEKDKAMAYADGLKRYCVASGFKDNHLANCSTLKTKCLESMRKNECNTYMWQWCADRNWNIRDYPQCGEALVGRYAIEKPNSSIWEREVKNWCSVYAPTPMCDSLGFKNDGRVHVDWERITQ